VKQTETEQARRADVVRRIVTRRERAPRSPRMERALKRLIWRYCLPDEAEAQPGCTDRQNSTVKERELGEKQ